MLVAYHAGAARRRAAYVPSGPEQMGIAWGYAAAAALLLAAAAALARRRMLRAPRETGGAGRDTTAG
jgi:hypothetical protein